MGKDAFRALNLQFLMVFNYDNVVFSKSFVPHIRFLRELEREYLPFFWMVDPISDKIYVLVSTGALNRCVALVGQFNLSLCGSFMVDYRSFKDLCGRILARGKSDRIVYWQTSRYVHYLIRSRPVYGSSNL